MCKPEVPKLAHAHTFCRGVMNYADHAKIVSGSPQDCALMCLRFDAKLPAILKSGNMESQKRPRSEHNDTSVSKTFPQIAIPIRTKTKEAVKLLLSERKRKADRVEMKIFGEIQLLEELKKRIAKIDENLHCEVESISGHPSSAVLCDFPSREKSFNDTIGSFQPVRYLFTPSGHYKFQVFIHKTIAEGKINIESFAELRTFAPKMFPRSDFF